MHSINIFSSSFAATSSTGQLIAIIPPKALTLSPSNALFRAEDGESPIATPQGFVCLITTAAFLYESFLSVFSYPNSRRVDNAARLGAVALPEGLGQLGRVLLLEASRRPALKRRQRHAEGLGRAVGPRAGLGEVPARMRVEGERRGGLG